MTRHSTLTNPNDLHYAKVRSFNGDPAAIYPEFADQLIIATDTNKIYRATDTTQGAIVELVAGSGGIIGFIPPDGRPTREGGFYFDQSANKLYIAVANTYGDLWWKPVEPMVNAATVALSLNSDDEFITNSATFALFFAPVEPSAIESGSYDFSRALVRDIPSIGGFSLSPYLSSTGRGCYVFGYAAYNPNNTLLTTNWTNLGSIPSGLELRSASGLTADGYPIGTTYLYFNGQNPDGLLDLPVSLNTVVVGG